MKKQIWLLILIMIPALTFAQNKIIFPGITDLQKQKLLGTKIPLPLPTWIPDGFSVINIITKTARSVKVENKILTITYGKKLASGHVLKFKIDAGFEGLGDLHYEGGERVKSKAGEIWLYYEPIEEVEDGRKIKYVGFIQTEWFEIKDLNFHLVFTQSENEGLNKRLPKISKADAKKILQSMQVLK